MEGQPCNTRTPGITSTALGYYNFDSNYFAACPTFDKISVLGSEVIEVSASCDSRANAECIFYPGSLSDRSFENF